DAGERNIKAELQRVLGEHTAGAEAMDDARLRALLLEDGDGLGIGVAGVNDERYARLVRRGDMGAKARFLLGARAMLIVEIEPGLADADHLGIARKPNEGIARDVGFLRRLVRVNADRAPDIAVAFG